VARNRLDVGVEALREVLLHQGHLVLQVVLHLPELPEQERHDQQDGKRQDRSNQAVGIHGLLMSQMAVSCKTKRGAGRNNEDGGSRAFAVRSICTLAAIGIIVARATAGKGAEADGS